MTLTATDVLEFLRKANILNMHPIIVKNDEGYYINLYDDLEPCSESVFITNENESTWHRGTYDFQTMNDTLNTKLEEKKQEQIKAQKRKELIDSLTKEQRELLGL